jgi:hypothetical protein
MSTSVRLLAPDRTVGDLAGGPWWTMTEFAGVGAWIRIAEVDV